MSVYSIAGEDKKKKKIGDAIRFKAMDKGSREEQGKVTTPESVSTGCGAIDDRANEGGNNSYVNE